MTDHLKIEIIYEIDFKSLQKQETVLPKAAVTASSFYEATKD